MTARSFMGAGDIFIDRVVDGIPQGLIGPIKANKVEIKPSVDTKESTSKGRYDYGQTLESVNLAKPTEFTLELKEVIGDILVMAFLGTSSDMNQPAGDLTAKQVTVARLGRWLELGVKNMDDLQVVTDEAGTKTYDEGVDYELNRPLGFVRALTGGAVAVNSKLKVTGGYKAATGMVIHGSTRTEVRARIVFDGVNQADSNQCTVEIHEAILAADSSFDFLADDFGNVTLTGRLKTPQGKTSPFEVLMQNPVVD